MPESKPAPRDLYDWGDTKQEDLLVNMESLFKEPPKPSAPVAGTPEIASPPATASPPPPVSHSVRHLRLAQDLGLTEAQAKSLSQEDLAEEIYIRTRTLAASRPATSSPSEPPKTAPPEPPPAPVLDFGEYEKELDPAFVTALKTTLGNELSKRDQELAALKQKLGEREDSERKWTQQQFFAAIDARLDKNERLYGKSRDTATPTQFARRRAIVDAISTSTEATFDARYAAAAALFEEAQPAAAPAAQPRPTEADYAQGALARPTERRREEPAGPDKALRTVTQWMREHNMLDDVDPDHGWLPAPANAR